MRFMMLVKADKGSEAGVMPSEELLTAMGKYNEELVKAGVLLSGEGLHPSAKGFRTKNVGGKVTVTEGPFSDAKGLVAGFWIIQVKSKEEAIEWAKRAPMDVGAAPGSTAELELRQVTEMTDFPPEAFEGMAEACPGDAPPAGAAPTLRTPSRATQRFMLMFKADARTEAGLPPSREQLASMNALTSQMTKEGVILGGEGLQPSAKGARVLFSGGRRTVVDGPFAETKELICGFVIVQVSSKEEAIELAKRGTLANGDCEGEGRQILTEEDFSPELHAKVPEVFEAERRMREGLAC